jgi:phage shock protein PspC (stress-responsive transcriptional regulator)/FtsH-binding integral membrane protein
MSLTAREQHAKHMTTSDTIGLPTPPPASGQRMLRRSRTNRVAAGVSSGLGDYFGVDPVLFRVLFATTAFFGGAGILAYLLAWAAIPEAGTEHAPIDSFIGWLRRRHVPVWLVAVAAGVLLWAIAFSWWAPGPFFWVIAVVTLLVIIFSRREMQATAPGPTGAPPAETSVDLSKGAATAEAPADQPAWVRDTRSWFEEARQASRTRRQRSLPIRIAMLVTLAVSLTVLGIFDAVTGIQLQVYFWTVLGIVGVGLLAGIVTRRTPVSMTPLLVPALAGVIAFGGSHASLHDGAGQREWKPTTAPAAQYKLAFGQGILDLRQLSTQDVARRIDITMAAGQVKIIAPRTLNLTVLANVHIGVIEVDGTQYGGHNDHSGFGLSRTVGPPAGATGAPLTIDVHLADGNLTVEHRG